MGKDIIKYRYIILIFFVIILVVACVFLPTMIKNVNYDLTSYLPEGYNTYDGYQFLSEHFNIHGDVEIGVEATYADTQKVVEKISAIDGVTGTTWADMLSYLPGLGVFEANDPEFIKLRSILTDAPIVDDGGLHNWAVLVTLKYPPSSPEAIAIFQNIKTLLGETVGNNYAMSGMTEQANALFESVFDEIGLYCLIAGIVVLLILAFTTSSLMEPIILLSVLGIAIVINLGTNAIFPSTSIITFACTAILQLGLSMDYAIFLLHQYRSELTKTIDPKTALANAIPKSAKAVMSSALTTVGGFLALLCMKFGVGSDLGLSLAKGVLCSLLTVIFLQPCLMLMFEKARVKTQHKCLNVQFKAPVKRVIKHKFSIAIVFAIVIIPMFFASNSLQYAYVKFLPPPTDTSPKSVMAQTLGNQVMILVPANSFTSDGTPITSSILAKQNYEFVERVQALGDKKISFMLGLFAMFPKDAEVDKEIIKKQLIDAGEENLAKLLDNISGKFDLETMLGFMPLIELIEPGLIDKMGFGAINSYISDGYTMYTVGINSAIELESKESFAILESIQAIANDIFSNHAIDADTGESGYINRCYFTGIVQGAYDFAAVTPNDFMWVTIISILAILVILILTLGSIKIPFLLVALIEFGIWTNLAMQYIFSGGTVNFMSYLIISAVQLGATVDYAILLSTRYKEYRKRFEPQQAAYLATTKSAMTIVTSALIMAGACLSVFFVSSNLVIKEMTFLMARGSIISAILVIFVLPGLLTLVDKRKGHEIHFLRTPKLRKYKIPSKSIKNSWKTESFGEVTPAKQDYSGMELYEMMSQGVDINKTSDSYMKRWLRKH